MGRRSRWEYFEAIWQRYHKANKALKGHILDEFCKVRGYNRKYATRKLNGPPPDARPKDMRRRGTRRYDAKTLDILRAVWEAARYPWSARLKALLPRWMSAIKKRFDVSPKIEKQLLSISPRQMDRRMKAVRLQHQRRIYGRTKPGTLLKHQIPIKTDRWDVKEPGYCEVALVSHPGNCADGLFAQSLNFTELLTTWVETRALLGKGQYETRRKLEEIEKDLPFGLLGIDSDNGSEFINGHLLRYCRGRKIQFTRGRPYKKDDNAHIEQKNWTHARKVVGHERYDSEEAVELLNDLYRNGLRWMMNLFQPSIRLLKKERRGARLVRKYDKPKTPLDRLIESGKGDAAKIAEFKKLRDNLDPFELSAAIDRKLKRIYSLANRRWSPRPEAHDEAKLKKLVEMPILSTAEQDALRTLARHFRIKEVRAQSRSYDA